MDSGQGCGSARSGVAAPKTERQKEKTSWRSPAIALMWRLLGFVLIWMALYDVHRPRFTKFEQSGANAVSVYALEGRDPLIAKRLVNIAKAIVVGKFSPQIDRFVQFPSVFHHLVDRLRYAIKSRMFAHSVGRKAYRAWKGEAKKSRTPELRIVGDAPRNHFGTNADERPYGKLATVISGKADCAIFSLVGENWIDNRLLSTNQLLTLNQGLFSNLFQCVRIAVTGERTVHSGKWGRSSTSVLRWAISPVSTSARVEMNTCLSASLMPKNVVVSKVHIDEGIGSPISHFLSNIRKSDWVFVFFSGSENAANRIWRNWLQVWLPDTRGVMGIYPTFSIATADRNISSGTMSDIPDNESGGMSIIGDKAEVNFQPPGLRVFKVSQLFGPGISRLPQRTELDTVDYCLGNGCDCKQEREENQCGVGVVSMANEDYELLDLSKQFSNASSELSEFNWKWLPLGIGGLICFLSGITVFFFAKRRSVILGLTLTVVGWVCGQIGFVRWFN
jgi:hypothetical protein